MPRISKLPRSSPIHNAPIAFFPVFDFLAPSIPECTSRKKRSGKTPYGRVRFSSSSNDNIESLFYTALTQVSQCEAHRTRIATRSVADASQLLNSKIKRVPRDRPSHSTKTDFHQGSSKIEGSEVDGVPKRVKLNGNRRDATNQGGLLYDIVQQGSSRAGSRLESDLHRNDDGQGCQTQESDLINAFKGIGLAQNYGKPNEQNRRWFGKKHGPYMEQQGSERSPSAPNNEKTMSSKDDQRSRWISSELRPIKHREVAILTNRADEVLMKLDGRRRLYGSGASSSRLYSSQVHDFDHKKRKFAESSHLPSGFFSDITALKDLVPKSSGGSTTSKGSDNKLPTNQDKKSQRGSSASDPSLQSADSTKERVDLQEQLKLLESIRELEEKVAKMKKQLTQTKHLKLADNEVSSGLSSMHEQTPIVLTKEDYMNLVDLYYHSHNSRFSPESTDSSPTPVLLDDYSFTLSSDFSRGQNKDNVVNESETYESPLKKVEEILKRRQLREIAVMQVFVDLLLDDSSSNRALYEAYEGLPAPGVSYLPIGIVRLLMQRMSTPWTLSEKSMLRYLSLIDEMQKAQIPITVAEWSSAVYLAGRAFSRVTGADLNQALQVWHTMEREAGVKASHVTFNILFDIAVRSGRFVLGETILKEMHSRNLRLNRLGRVSLMYYHGLRKDGDGVRKAYRDFVEAGEIVDTLVLNCVIASLLNAQEPQAAEQVYARMKNMHLQLRKGFPRDGHEALYKRYPDPGGNTIDQEMASNHLGRILEKAPRLRDILPEHHQALQASMPLVPDHVTFRSMIAYHATTSGDLDRLTVILQEMTDVFSLPLQSITFQLLFKGFTLHGPTGGPDGPWSVKRLELCWNACRAAIKVSQVPRSSHQDEHAFGEHLQSNTNEEDQRFSVNITLPSITQINAIPKHAPLPNFNPPLSRPPPRRLSDWAEFVLDLAAFPRERLKRLERFHATMFDAEDMVKPHEKRTINTYQSPFFQSTAYTAPEPKLDTEEGEYELPNPVESGVLYDEEKKSEGRPKDRPSTSDPMDESLRDLGGAPHQVFATRTLVCWLLRAYARNTKSRAKVEEIWGQVRKLYKPWDATEREGVVRVFRRCLRDCDQEGGG